ncbi:MAG: DUF418 domain-containing protein [Chloroflexota bacterium]|nr:DUF418 domain-containing protein [Chloroflexota bacterium]
MSDGPVRVGEGVKAAGARYPDPISGAERIQELDVLRGFAIFGILLVNMAFFSTPLIYDLMAGTVRFGAPYDRLATWLIRFLAEAKFYTLFSFLFGLGLFVQMSRAEARGVAFVPLYIRRLLVLLLIGLTHAFLVWSGDILVTYALLGFLLLLFRRRSPRALLWWATAMLAMPLLFYALSTLALAAGGASPEAAAQIERSFRETATSNTARAEASVRAFGRGTFAEIMAQRTQDTLQSYAFLPLAAPNVLAMFLLGLYAGRRGVFRDIPGHLPLIRRVLVWGWGIGLAGNLLYATAQETTNRAVPTGLGLLAQAGQTLGAPALCLGYAAGLVLLMQQASWRHRLAPLAAVGRMALSNYLLQSLVCTTIFYSYGLGLFGQVGPAAGILLAIVIYLAQVPLSVWWLRRFQFGPAEWLSRSLTYLRRQPIKRAAVRLAGGDATPLSTTQSVTPSGR